MPGSWFPTTKVVVGRRPPLLNVPVSPRAPSFASGGFLPRVGVLGSMLGVLLTRFLFWVPFMMRGGCTTPLAATTPQQWQLKIIPPRLLAGCCFPFFLFLTFVFLFSLSLFYFILLDWRKRWFILLFYFVILEIFLQFLLKIVICLLDNFNDGTCHARDISYRLKCCF